MKNSILLGLKGSLIGVALVVPGLSAGTMAFITGLYSTFISFLSSFLPSVLNREWRKITKSFLFLSPAFLGILISFLISARWVILVIEKFPLDFNSFFSGVILMSVVYLSKQMKLDAVHIVIAILSALFSFSLSFKTKLLFSLTGELFGTFWFFLSVYLSILAMLLPGVSGSYILMIMGSYSRFLTAFQDLSVDLIIIGLAFFVSLFSGVKWIKYLMDKKREKMMAFLTGLTLGGGFGIFPRSIPTTSSLSLFLLSFVLVGILSYFFGKIRKNQIDLEKNSNTL